MWCHRCDEDPFAIFCTADKALKKVARNLLQTGDLEADQAFRNLLLDTLSAEEVDNVLGLLPFFDVYDE